jgi:hypothetical protein
MPGSTSRGQKIRRRTAAGEQGRRLVTGWRAARGVTARVRWRRSEVRECGRRGSGAVGFSREGVLTAGSSGARDGDGRTSGEGPRRRSAAATG